MDSWLGMPISGSERGRPSAISIWARTRSIPYRDFAGLVLDEDGADEPEYASAELDTELELDFEEEVELDFVEDELPADDGALSEAAVEPEPLSLPDPLSSENSAAALASFRLKEKYPLLLALLLTRAFAATICRNFP